MANVLNTILTTVQTALQSSVTLTSSDNEVAAIASANIVIRKIGLREKDYEAGHLLEQMPGILIVPGKQECPPDGGTDQADAVYYNIDLVICDRDDERQAGIATYTQWMQNIRQYFNNRITGWPNDAASGIVWNCWALACDAVNDWRWVNHREAVTGVRLRLVSWEPRG